MIEKDITEEDLYQAIIEVLEETSASEETAESIASTIMELGMFFPDSSSEQEIDMHELAAVIIDEFAKLMDNVTNQINEFQAMMN